MSSGIGVEPRRTPSGRQRGCYHHPRYSFTFSPIKTSLSSVGAVLSHVLEDGTERPIYYASRSLAIAEKKYSQLDKEGLAIIFAVKRFHQFLFGRPFLIKSDHKPLQYIFGHTHPVPPLASARLQRWALILGAYDYKIVYRPGGEIGNADGLSRLPLPNYPTDIPVPGETILLMRNLELSEITAERISQWTSRDPLLSRIRRFLQLGWPHLTDVAERMS